MLSIMIFIVGNEIGDPSSNPEQGYFVFYFVFPLGKAWIYLFFLLPWENDRFFGLCYASSWEERKLWM